MARGTILMAAVAIGCASTRSVDDEGALESANTGGIAEGTVEAAIVVKAANEASLQALVDEAQISKLAALAIDAYRKGDDLQAGTEDDARFESIAELDALPHVGPNEFQALLAFARRQPSPVISGMVLFGNDSPVQPPVSIYALKADGTKYYKHEGTINAPYALAVEPGDYYVVAYRGPFVAYGYTTPDHLLAKVSVQDGNTANINPVDTLVKRVPIEPTSPLTFGCAQSDYAGRCGNTSELDPGPGYPQDTVTWCEGNLLRRKICPIEQRCAWESDAIGFNCVAR